ncbi:sensor histidine kinase [Priestia megaterium]|uniref:sensor histidine kinase n=1 Tax=Priestia megaterium TaxID=1404 RepID=UPI0024528692|nr:histidine kinase [Priestia megaterium]MDH3183675.1 histidine kinase [Priestia megaterium]
MDLRKSQYTQKGFIKLDGQWDYFPGEHLDLEDIKNRKKKNYVEVPSVQKGRGIATYHLQIILPNKKGNYGFKTTSIRMAHSLYVNDKKLSKSGTSGKLSSYSPGNTPGVTYFTSSSDKIDLIIHTANYSFVDQGIVSSIYFGTQNKINTIQNLFFGSNFSFVIFGIMFSVYQFILYFMRRQDRFLLYGGCYFLTLVMAILFSGEKISLQIFPNIPFELAYKAKDFFGFFSGVFLLLFSVQMESGISSFKKINVAISPIIIYLIAILVLPYSLYVNAQYISWMYLGGLLIWLFARCLYLYVTNTFKKMKKNELMTFIFALGSIVFYLMCEIANSILSISFFYQLGIILFILFMFILFALMLSNSINSYEKVKKEAVRNEMLFLNSQIKPHFLYNALSNIIALCYTNQHRAAYLLQNLSTYLRIIFDNDSRLEWITLEKEIKLITAYVEIEKERLNGRLSVEWLIDEGLEYTMVPFLSVQPIVENAIRHGLFPKEGDGKVTIIISQDMNLLKIVIKDDGIGMDEIKLQKIKSKSKKHKGVGLINVQKRINKIPNSYFNVDSTPSGTSVCILFPIIFAKEKA